MLSLELGIVTGLIVINGLLGIELPLSRPYQTCAGYLLEKFGAIPDVGQSVAADGWRFEIVDLDGRRIDKVLAMKDRAD